MTESNDNYPVPDPLHEAWDKFIEANDRWEDLSQEKQKLFLIPFAEELGFKKNEPVNWEELYRALLDLSLAHNLRKNFLPGNGKALKLDSSNNYDDEYLRYRTLRFPQEADDRLDYFTEDHAKLFFEPMYYNGDCHMCESKGVITRSHKTKTPGKNYLECPKCNSPLMPYPNSTVGMLQKNNIPHARFNGETRSELMGKIPDKQGVYIISEHASGIPIYIGCAGKLEKGGIIGGQTIRKRMFGATTPYHFDRTEDVFRYEPTSSGVPPDGYAGEISISDLDVVVIITDKLIAPSTIEHYLIQCFIFRFGDLPEANQRI